MKKITAYVWAFILLIVAFFTVGAFTLGSTKSTGDSMTVVKNQAVHYQLSSSQTVKAVYVNVGGIHTELGENLGVTVKTSTSLSAVPSSTLGSTVTFANVYNETGKSGVQYNWFALTTGQSRGSVRRISVTGTANFELNELIVINSSNQIVELKPYIPGSGYAAAEVNATLDKQDAFADFIGEDGVITLDNDAKANFTQEEGYFMSSIRNVLSGKDKYEDSVYVLDGNFNYLASVLYAPSVALFGVSTFALRLPTLIATCLLIVFAFLLIKELTKKEEYAFWFAVALTLGGVMTTVGRLGAPYMVVASALVASAYYMYRFFSYGIGKNVFRGGANILISGLFAAVAMATDITAAIPVVGILVLFAFAMRRQALAKKVALEKLAGAESVTAEETDGATSVAPIGTEAEKIKASYRMKNRVAYGFTALGFVMGTVLLCLFAAVICYSAYVRAYNNTEVNFLKMLWEGIAGSARDNGVTAYTATGISGLLSWLLPYAPTTLYEGVTAAADGTYLGWRVLINGGAQILSVIAFLAVSVKFALDLARKKNDKKTLRIRRTYLVLVGGMALAVLAAIARGNVSALTGVVFHVCYLGFLPLAATLLSEGDSTSEKIVRWVAVLAVIVMIAAVFALSVPVSYGYTVMTSRAKWFSWLSIGF